MRYCIKRSGENGRVGNKEGSVAVLVGGKNVTSNLDISYETMEQDLQSKHHIT